MPSFDVVLEPEMVEVRNAVDQTSKEIGTRFDFKGTGARVELKEKEKEIILYADSDFQLGQVRAVVLDKMAKRKVDVRFLNLDTKPEKMGGDKFKQVVTVKVGIESELAKKIVKFIKDSKIKVQGSIQGDAVRVQGKNRDDLQATMTLLREKVVEAPLSFNNFRD